jgi:SAM-dependent methyltransferase
MDSSADWAAGYVTEVGYTFGYYRELSPGILRLASLVAGIAPPAGQPLRYLELGFGQGLSINVHAAAIPGTFWGTDFNPGQVAHARALAEASGSGAVLLDESFEDLAARADLPEFDIIALHGVWTWISDENRRCIVDLIRRKLRAGGLVYISYNCFPGWAPAEPLRHLMSLHSELAGSEVTGTIGKVDGALAFARSIADSGALYFKSNPAVTARLKQISEQPRNYLAHEYFNRDWELMPFSDVAQWLATAKLSFAASAHLLDHTDAVNLTPEGQKLLAGIAHPILRQTVRDYFVSQQFRRDIFVKGARRLTPLEQHEALRAQAFVLTTPADEVPMKFPGPIGEVTMSENLYRPLIAAFADHGHAPKTFAKLCSYPEFQSPPAGLVMQSVLVLTGIGHLSPAQQPSEKTRKYCRALNKYLCERARSSADIGFLASPVLGSAVPVDQVEQSFLLAVQNGKAKAKEQAAFVWNLMAQASQRLVKEGKTIEAAEENLAELERRSEIFLNKRLPILKALEIA